MGYKSHGHAFLMILSHSIGLLTCHDILAVYAADKVSTKTDQDLAYFCFLSRFCLSSQDPCSLAGLAVKAFVFAYAKIS